MPLNKEPLAKAIEPGKLTAKITDAAKVKAYLQKAGVKSAEINKLAWGKPDDIIGSVVKLHGATLADYRAGGLG